MRYVHKRLLILTVMLASLCWLNSETAVQASGCSQCDTTQYSCMSSCDSSYHVCISGGNPYGDCAYTYTMCLGACSDAYNQCANQNCGPSGGGGPTCDGMGNGYSRSCAEFQRGNRNDCLANGSSGATYQACMSGGSGSSSDQEYCCDQQINADIQQNCVCQLDSRNPDCVCNP